MSDFDWDDMPFGPAPLPPAGLGFDKGFGADHPQEPIIVGEEDRDFGFSKSFDFEQPRAVRRSSSTSSDEPKELGSSGAAFDHFYFGGEPSGDSVTPALSNDETPFSANIGASDFDGIHFEPLFQSQALQPHAFANAFSTGPTDAPAITSVAPQQQSTVTCSPKELFADASSPPFGVEPLTLKSPPPASQPAQPLFDYEAEPAAEPESDVDNDPTFAIEESTARPAKKTTKPRASTKRKRVASVSPSEDGADKTDKFTGTRKTNVPMVDLDAPIAARTYAAPSRTSRKEVPVLMQRQFKKQKRDISADVEDGGDLEPDAKAEIDSKRKANTIAARRSRQRKAEHLKTLENSLEQARTEAAEERELRLRAEQRLVKMEDRLAELERMLSTR